MIKHAAKLQSMKVWNTIIIIKYMYYYIRVRLHTFILIYNLGKWLFILYLCSRKLEHLADALPASNLSPQQNKMVSKEKAATSFRKISDISHMAITKEICCYLFNISNKWKKKNFKLFLQNLQV